MVRKKVSAWTKNNLREVKNTLERYIAIFAIISLGVAFFAGLVITRDAMVVTLDKYLIDHNMYDYRLLSTIGFDKDDHKHFTNLEGLESVEGAISIDFLAYLPEANQTIVVKAHSITDEINQLDLVSGKLPENADETLVDDTYFPPDSIGQKIKISFENEEDTIDSFATKEYTIVGTVKSTEYISHQRGTTSLANGSVNAFIYIPEDGFDMDYYTEMYLKLEEDGFPFSSEYEDLINDKENMVEIALDESAHDRFDYILEEANEEITEGEQEYEDGLAEYLSEKTKVITELEDAYSKLVDGQKEIEENEQKLLDGEKEIEDGFKEYNNGLKKYEDGLTEFEKTKASTLKTLEDSQREIDSNRAQINAGIKEIEDSEVVEQYAQVTSNLTDLESAKAQIDESGVRETYAQLQDGLIEIEAGQKEINSNRDLVNAGITSIENNPKISQILAQFTSLSDGIAYYENAKSQLLVTGGPMDSYAKLKEQLAELNGINESNLTEDEKLQLEKNKSAVLNGMEQIESTGVISQFESIDLVLDTLYRYKTLQDNLDTINENQDKLNEQKNLITAGIKEIENSEHFDFIINYDEQVVGNIKQLKAAKTQIEESGVLETYPQLQQALVQLNEGQAQLNRGLATANSEFVIAEQELISVKSELDAAYTILETSKKEIDDGKEALEEGKAELEDGFAEYEDGKAEAEEGFAEAEEELEDAKIKLEDAKQEIAELDGPTTYIFNRSHNSNYTSFNNDSAIVAGIAKVLPIFFFLVAALVCSSTMSRMVDEQRTQIGTLKSLGYSDRKITGKFMNYAASAALIGCILGYFLGTKFFPMAIWTAYGMIYQFAPLKFIFDWKLALISLIASLISSAGVTYITCKNELTQPPAELIRLKAPKAGKRIFLERIPVIWSKISFLRKVSIRNVFRFKKRLLMTVLGVAGCTALIIAALGIKDSIGNVANYQFDDIMTYDYDIYFTEELSEEERIEFTDKYADILSENVFIAKETFELVKGSQTKTFNVVTTDDSNITNLIDLHLEDEDVPYPEDGQVAISHKMAEQADISIGDNITIKVSDTKQVEASVGGIFENYIDNYMYMTENTYEMLFNQEAEYLNAIASRNIEDLDEVAKKLTSHEKVAAIISTQNIRDSVDDTMTSLNYVIWVVLAFALALAFVVVYNLNNINITERTHEIATLKVLGFYPKETYIYVFRENIILTAIGILFGLILGKGLLIFIMNEIQVDFVAFKLQVFPESYLTAVIVTFLLTVLVNRMLKGKIDNINMTESLNSGE